MTAGQITLRGTVLPDGTLQLTGPVSLPPGPVEIVVRSIAPAKQGEGVLAVLARIRAEQAASGYVPRSAEEIDAYLRELREEWEARDASIEAIHAASGRGGEMPSTGPGPAP